MRRCRSWIEPALKLRTWERLQALGVRVKLVAMTPDHAFKDDLSRLPAQWRCLAQARMPDEAATSQLAAQIAPLLGTGDTILLDGTLGSGKTHFARALIRARFGAEGAAVEVPSPSFTLVQTYAPPGPEIWHSDLYRLGDPQEVLELGLDEAFETAICLIEWPSRLDGGWPASATTLRFDTPADAPDARDIALWADPSSDLAARLRLAVQGA